jgi:hypothetical protein
MASKLSKSTKIWTLARDLRLKVKGDPTVAIREYCQQRVARIRTGWNSGWAESTGTVNARTV